MTTTTEELRQLAHRGVGFDMNPTMMFTTAESMYSQWLDYFTRLDREWRERVAAAADALSTPPADDVREALLAVRDEIVRNGGKADAACLATLEAIASRSEVRPRGTITEPTAEDVEQMRAVLNAADVDYSAREQRADAGGGDMEPGDWFAFIARAVLRAGAGAPRGTVTDAEVEAAARRMRLRSHITGLALLDWEQLTDRMRDSWRDAARDVLIAAAEARS